MALKIENHFAFETSAPTDILLQFEAAMIPEQRISNVKRTISNSQEAVSVPAQDDIGERIWLCCEGRIDVEYEATVEVERVIHELASLQQLSAHNLPGPVIPYMFDSRYCQANNFQRFADEEFGGTSGGARVQSIHDWIAEHLSYVPGSSGPNTTALDSFIERQGICRDYAHVLVTLARASGIPARFVSCYAPRVTPQDFHAVAEVFLADPTIEGGGLWHLVDATEMSTPPEIVRIGVGRDAADVSFLTSFGASTFLDKTISVTENSD